MRGRKNPQGGLFYVVDVEALVPGNHPLRGIKERADEELARLRPHFEAAYAKMGRPSVPPEHLIKATLLQALYTIRSERRLCEEIGYNMLYRWFLDLSLDSPVWDHSTFSANRERFAQHGLMRRFFEGSVARAIQEEAASMDHFSVDGTLIASWASMKSLKRKDADDREEPPAGGGSNRWVDWRGEKRSNRTHRSATDPEARLMRKGRGREAMLAHSMHALMENRNGLVMGIGIDEANGTAERSGAEGHLKCMRRRHWVRPKTVGADKAFDDGAFLLRMEDAGIVPHVAVREGKIASQDPEGLARRRARRRQRSRGYRISQRARRRIEEVFAWLKEVGGMRRARFVGRWKIQLYAYAAAASYNLLRMTRMAAAQSA